MPPQQAISFQKLTDLVRQALAPLKLSATPSSTMMQAMVAEDHRRAALFATAQQHAKETLIDEDHRQASLKATANQCEMEARGSCTTARLQSRTPAQP